MENNDITKKIINTIREGIDNNRKYTAKPIKDEVIKEKTNFLTEAKSLMEKASKKKELIEGINKDTDNAKRFKIEKSTPQFGDVYTSQVDSLKKTLQEDIEVELFFYPELKDLVLNGKAQSLGIYWQFRFKDSETGCYLWANELPLNDENTRTLGKLRDAYLNWKKNLIENDDIIEKLSKNAKK